MKIYTIIAGVNGVGKSSLTGVLIGESSDLGVIVDTDKITAELGGDKLRGGKAAIERINSSLEKGINLTQETTISGAKTLKTIKKARDLDYFIRMYYVGVSTAEESIKRIKNRVEKGGHDIPKSECCAAIKNALRILLLYFPIVTRSSFMITKTVLLKRLNTKTVRSLLRAPMYRNGWRSFSCA